MKILILSLLLKCYLSSYYVNAFMEYEDDLLNAFTKYKDNLLRYRREDFTPREEIDRTSYIKELLEEGKSPETSTEYPGYDGWYNNLGNPKLGAVDTPLLRRYPAVYEDGVYKMSNENRVNPFVLSEGLLKGEVGTKSRTGKNVLMVFFGQHIVEEILDSQRAACPPEYINIDIPEGYPYRNNTGYIKMPVLRTRYDEKTGHSPNNPRQQLNEITPFLDGGLIYGTTKTWSDYLRMYSNGKIDPDGLLAYSHGGKFPEYNTVRLPMANPPPPAHHHKYVSRHYTEKVDRFFKLGNPRGNENPFLLTFGIIWFRWHNAIARELKNKNPDWSGEKIYNEARKWVIASQQKIVFYDWLPQWLGINSTDYKEYDPTVNPQIDQFFQSAAFRFGHTLVPAGVYLRDYGELGCGLKLNGRAIRTCNNFWMSENGLFDQYKRLEGPIDVERLLMGMAVQLTEAEDHKVVEDLRGNLFGPLEFSRRDLMALNIQRARDHGLPDYNTARKVYNLDIVTSIDHFQNVDDTIKEKFLNLYNQSFDNVDIWIGGILETEDGPGELFRKIIADQFERIRKGDRFWFENSKNGLFTPDEVDKIMDLNFYKILLSVTDVGERDFPQNVFKVPVSTEDININCTLAVTVVKGDCKFLDGKKIECYHALPVTLEKVDNCTKIGTYDYFSNSELSFCLTFLGLAIFFIGFIGFLYCKLQLKYRKEIKKLDIKKCDNHDPSISIYTANEWMGYGISSSPVGIIFDKKSRQIQIKNQLGNVTRALYFPQSQRITFFAPHYCQYLLIRAKNNYDLVLKFSTIYLRNLFTKALERFFGDLKIQREIVSRITLRAVLKQAITVKDRRKRIAQFFRVVFAQAFSIAHSEDEMLRIDAKVAKEVIYTELTLLEFADALSMRADSEFVKKIFNLVDKDKNGFISFREFLDMLVLFLKGTADEKLKLMFDMYDINGTGQLKMDDFLNMLESFLATVNIDIPNDELKTLIDSMMHQAQVASKAAINLEDFKKILGEFNDKFSYAELEFNVNSCGAVKKLHAGKKIMRSKFIGEVKETMESLYADPNELKSRVEGKIELTCLNNRNQELNNSNIVETKRQVYYWSPIMKYIANNRLQIFWMFFYTTVLIGIFAERFYYYSVLREHKGLRQIMGYGVALTRGAASAMMFCYSSMLLMMCHNIITVLRDSILQFYIPFDSAIEMHKYTAYWALFFTIVHIIGHGFNFYHISTQTADDLTCLFRNNFHSTHELPKFNYWIWSTTTGLTSILLTIVTGTIFICSIPIVRRKLYRWFAYGHTLYPLFYILVFLHGSGRLIQEPFFHYFFIIPGVLFTMDKIYSATRKTIEIPLLKADLLPSGVTNLIFPKPLNFNYKSGQWIRISCPRLNAHEFHPFTLSSAPHEPTLSVHIRAVGPWTNNLRNQLDPCRKRLILLPSIHIDGPYGESHQNWNKYDFSLMVAGDIGVTPFASVLKDIVYKSNEKINLCCKKVYFLWVTRSQKQFEWMVDILRDIEKADINNVISAHIFITQFYQKFDLRTILLYICERHFQKVSNKSLFTGLTAVTHFGRPNFTQFFSDIQRIHSDINKIGVFSCGSPTLTRSVDDACQNLNSRENTNTLFQHYYKAY